MATKRDLPPVPQALADVALVEGRICAAAAGISLSAWYDLVRAGAAPAPAFRAPRCTRWRMSDIRAWLIERAGTDSDTQPKKVAQAAAGKACAATRARWRATSARGS